MAVDDVETELTTVDVPEQAPEEAPQRGDDHVVAELENTRTQDFGLVGVTWELGTAAEDLVVEITRESRDTYYHEHPAPPATPSKLEGLGGGDGHGHPDRLHLTVHADGVHVSEHTDVSVKG